MALRKILRASYKVLTTPLYLLELIAVAAKYSPIINDYEKCIKAIESTTITEAISHDLVRTLIVSEDHRNSLHYGVDQIAIARSIKLRATSSIKQGASTIEQQTVRTITGRYEKTSRRKIREQLLAIMISKKFSKEKICKAYLAIAYYGYNKKGTSGLKKITNENPEIKNIEIISLLKYPTGRITCEKRNKQISERATHIAKLLETPELPLLLSWKMTTKGDKFIFLRHPLLLVSPLRRVTFSLLARKRK